MITEYKIFIRQHMKTSFPHAVSYNSFVELESRVFFLMMFFPNLSAFGRCTGISFVDSTMLPVCHNLRRYANKVFKDQAADEKGTMGWCHDFKLHLVCNDRGEIITFCFTGVNVDDRNPKYGLYWQRRFTESSLPTWDTSHQGSSTCYSLLGYVGMNST